MLIQLNLQSSSNSSVSNKHESGLYFAGRPATAVDACTRMLACTYNSWGLLLLSLFRYFPHTLEGAVDTAAAAGRCPLLCCSCLELTM